MTEMRSNDRWEDCAYCGTNFHPEFIQDRELPDGSGMYSCKLCFLRERTAQETKETR